MKSWLVTNRLCQIGFAFAAMKALSARDVPPEKASCPYSDERDGFVLSEGAGVLVFEEWDHAVRRGAKMHAEVVGYGASSDAEHITQPLEDGRGAASAMANCLRDAGLKPEDVRYVNAHGTSTPLGDVAETLAIRNVFGKAADGLAVSSTKSSTGHLLGASGGVELLATVRAMRHGLAPPTINLDRAGKGCDLDYVPNRARDLDIPIAMSNSFGFGGHNACIAVRRID